MVSLKRKIVRNTIANYSINIWNIIISFILLPFIVQHIGIIPYGIYTLVGAITGYFGLLDFGIGPALVKYIAEYQAKKEQKKIIKTINSCFYLYLGIGIISCISFFLIGLFVIQNFNMPYEYVQIAQLVMYLLAVGTLFSFPLKTFEGALGGLQRYDIRAYIGFISSLVNVTVIVTVLLMGYGLIELVLFSLVCLSITKLLNVYYVKKLLPFLKIKWKYVTKRTLRKIFRFGGVMFILSFCTVIIYQTDQIVIGLFLTVGALTYYAIAAKLHSLVRQANGLMSSAILPAASELEALRKEGTLRKLLLTGSKYTCAIVLPLTICVLFLAEPIIRFWMGEDFLSVSILGKTTSVILVTQVFVLYWILNTNTSIAGTILIGINKIRLFLWYSVSVTLANIILSLILVQKIGILGVVMGTTIPYVIGVPIFMFYALKLLKIRKSVYFKKVVLRTYPQAGIITVMLYYFIEYHLPNNLFEVGIYGLLTLGVYFILFYMIGLNTKEKGLIKHQITNIMKPNNK